MKEGFMFIKTKVSAILNYTICSKKVFYRWKNAKRGLQIIIIYICLLCGGASYATSTQNLSAETQSPAENTRSVLLSANKNLPAHLNSTNTFQKLAQDKDPHVRQELVKTLGEKSTPTALTLLQTMAEDPEEDVKIAIISSLFKIHESAVQFLAITIKKKEKEEFKKTRKIKKISRSKFSEKNKNFYFQKIKKADNKEQAQKNAIALAKQTKEKVIELLSKMTKDKNTNVRAKAVLALGNTQDPKNLPLLEQIAKNTSNKKDKYNSVKKAVIYASFRIYQSAEGFLSEILANKVKQAGKKKRWKYKRGFVRSNDYKNFYWQINPEKKLNETEQSAITLAKQTKEKVVALLSKMTKDKDITVREKAVSALGDTHDPKVLPLLEQTAKNTSNKQDKYNDVKKAVVVALSQVYTEAYEFLSTVVIKKAQAQAEKTGKKKRGGRGFVRSNDYKNFYWQINPEKKLNETEQSAITLAKQTKEKVVALLSKIAKDKHINVREKAIKALMNTHDPKTLPILEKFVKDTSHTQDKYNHVKKIVINASLKMYKEAEHFLSEILTNKETARVKKIAKRNKYNINFYTKIINLEKNLAKGEKSAITLAKQTKEKVVALLSKIAKDKDPKVREKAVSALGDTHNLKVLPLLEKMTKDPSVEVRKATIRAIGKLK